ncbi:hypothetical protein PW52_04025 [Tamlana sedimentorum]|uniref:Uncharacterized protein n=1 Tax=Neotamlana sedimentorum TaxID=1435349 RepID=A0A0D7WCC4_9FLAO|nr:hypothetical protein PW52_04025 [Tamlana sedimentorum]
MGLQFWLSSGRFGSTFLVNFLADLAKSIINYLVILGSTNIIELFNYIAKKHIFSLKYIFF